MRYMYFLYLCTIYDTTSKTYINKKYIQIHNCNHIDTLMSCRHGTGMEQRQQRYFEAVCCP